MTPQQAKRAVRDGWVAGLIALFVSVMLTLIYASGGGFAHLALLNWIELALLAALSYGVYRQSRVSAVLLLTFHIGSKLYLWINESALIGVPLALIFAYFYWQAVRGTFALHEEQNARSEAVAVHG